ncbi:hypothetical protein V2A60_008798 [Cordyceps javanica]
MVNMMLLTILSFSAALSNGSVIPRQGSGDVNLAALIRNDEKVQRHEKSILRALNKGLPYSEGLLDATETVIKLDGLKEDERKCLFLRSSVKQEGFESILNVNPHLDAPEIVTGHDSKPIESTKSTALVATERLGWNNEVAPEIGGSATAEVSGGIGFFSASLSATVYGNQRSSEGENGKASTQHEYSDNTIKGSCVLTPFFDEKCSTGDKSKSKHSLGLFPTCQPLQGVATQFLDFDYDKYQSASGFGGTLHGIKMHKPELIKANKYEDNCTFTYVLRYENGDPNFKVTKAPKAVGWFKQTMVRDPSGGQGNWEYRDDLAEPEGLNEKCSEYSLLSRRAEASAPYSPDH